jgi:hypothetical protein
MFQEREESSPVVVRGSPGDDRILIEPVPWFERSQKPVRKTSASRSGTCPASLLAARIALASIVVVILITAIPSNSASLSIDSKVSALPAVQPVYGYLEKTYALPHFNPLQGYLANANGLDTQLPTLTSDSGQKAGIYYIDNASNLDLLHLGSDLVRKVAHVTLLYQRWGYNAMLDNEFWIEYGYDRALFFGTTTMSGTTYSLEVVDLGSGHVEMWNTSGTIDRVNQQAEYVGNDTVLVFSSNDQVVAYNLKSGRSWSAGTVSFFEANNIYWLPQKQQLISVEAQGSPGDQVEQLNATYDSMGHIHLEPATWVKVDYGVRFNFVNGIGYNDSAREIAFAAGYYHGDAVYTYVIPYGSNGLLTTSGEKRYAIYEQSNAVNATLFQGQRYVYTSSYVRGAFISGVQYLFDPWTGATIPTNRSFMSAPCPNACFEGTYGRSVAFQIDLNASLRLNVPLYKVVYAYHSPSKPFPRPTSSPLATPSGWGSPVRSLVLTALEKPARPNPGQGPLLPAARWGRIG